jgi:hypothetical protein
MSIDLKKSAEAAAAAKSAIPIVEPVSAPVSAAPKFQHYSSAKSSMKMITPGGLLITFTAYSFQTNNEVMIEYLDSEISIGNTALTKGELLTEEEASPIAALKAKHFAEFEAQQAATVAAGRDMGNTTDVPKAINPVSTDEVAN